MPNLEAQAAWTPVREIGIELARGGPNGNMNEQAKSLLARTEFLNQEKANKSEIVQGIFEFSTYAEFNSAKANLPLNCTVVINEENNSGTGSWGGGNNRWNGNTLIKSNYDPYLKTKNYVDSNANFKPIKIGDVSLDTLTKVGIYFATETALAKIENNYPFAGLTGIIHVAKSSGSSLVFQEFRSASGTDYWRSWNSVSWSAWKLKIDLSIYEKKEDSFSDYGVLTNTNNLNDLIQAGRWVLSSGTNISSLELNYPKKDISGVLEVVKNKLSSVVSQKFTSWETGNPVLYVRMFRNSWSPWIALGSEINAIKDSGLISDTLSLNDIKKSGFYVRNNTPTVDFDSLGYPIRTPGMLSVFKSDSSSLIYQKYLTANLVEYIRNWNGSTWSSWVDFSISKSNFMKIVSTFSADMSADDLKNEFSVFIVNNSSLDLVALGLPIKSTGVLKVYKGTMSSFVVQEFTTSSGSVYTRTWNNVTWSAWSVYAPNIPNFTNYLKIVSTFSADMNANDLRTEAAIYIVNSTSSDLVALGLPVKSLGILKSFKGTASSFVVQEFSTVSGVIYTRYWNNVTWSAWVSSDKSGPAGTSDLIQFTKTETAMQWYRPNSGTGTNKVRHTFNRGITPENNRDSWAMGTASIFSSSNAFLYNLTTTGVWEVAIIDSENVGDHSGGGHGDEVKSLSYFLVDGIYKQEDFAETFTAKEVQHVQRSTIYVEAQNVPICIRETTWTFNKNGCNSKTRLIFPSVRTITKARISMLPIYRKSNQDGTGNQITDIEIRSQDLTPIDVSVHGFERRDLPIKDGDSILLCSDISKISADVVIKKIKAPDPHAYVQNTILYNKVYVNAFAETAPPHLTKVGEVWEVEADFIIKVRS